MIAFEAITTTCPVCEYAIAGEPAETHTLFCPRCRTHIEIDAFPALLRQSASHLSQAVVADEATCYFHSDRVAAFACNRCGRFLCPLCRIEWAGEELCPACLEAASRGEQHRQLASTRFHFDTLALLLSTVLLLTGFLTILTAPLALGFALFTFRKECSIAPRTKIRFVLAVLFSTATIAAWVAFFVYTVKRGT